MWRLWRLLAVLVVVLSIRTPAFAQAIAHDATAKGTPVHIPQFWWIDVELKPNTEEEDEPTLNGCGPCIDVRRAKNLTHARHYHEALRQYQDFAKSNHYGRSAEVTEFSWGVTCESAGLLDEAVQHYAKSFIQFAAARVFLSQGKFDQAKKIADEEIDRCKSQKRYLPQYLGTLEAALRVRAAVEAANGDDKAAVSDLKEAARIYYIRDGSNAQLCVDDANALIRRSSLGAPLKVADLIEPKQDDRNVVALLRFLMTDPKPFELTKINEFTGAHLKEPGPNSRYCGESAGTGSPPAKLKPEFKDVEYYTDPDDRRVPLEVSMVIDTNVCCISKSFVDSLLPSTAVPAQSFDDPFFEVYKLPAGFIKLRFGKSAARVVDFVSRSARETPSLTTADDCWRYLSYASGNDSALRLELLSKCIELDPKHMEAYRLRAQLLTSLNRADEARSDLKHVVALCGSNHLSERAEAEDQLGDYDGEIGDLKELLSKNPTPTINEWFFRPDDLKRLYLRRLGYSYLKRKNFDAVLEFCRSLANSPDASTPETSTLATFLKAKAEAGLGQFAQARSDGEAAAQQYFEQARIVLRDEVLEWLKTLPAAS